MASVIDLAPPPVQSRSYRTIRRASRGFELLFAGLFIGFIALMAFSLWVLWFYQGTLIVVGPRGGQNTTETPPADNKP